MYNNQKIYYHSYNIIKNITKEYFPILCTIDIPTKTNKLMLHTTKKVVLEATTLLIEVSKRRIPELIQLKNNSMTYNHRNTIIPSPKEIVMEIPCTKKTIMHFTSFVFLFSNVEEIYMAKLSRQLEPARTP